MASRLTNDRNKGKKNECNFYSQDFLEKDICQFWNEVGPNFSMFFQQ